MIHAQAGSGSQFFSYKGTFSVVLLAVVDADYCFMPVFSHSLNLERSWKRANYKCHYLHRDPLTELKHVIVGDEGFPLKKYLMRPYPDRDLDKAKTIFNYWLSRARRVSENAFGILTACWRLYQRRIHLSPDNVDNVIKATCILHNYLRMTRAEDEPFSWKPAHPMEFGVLENVSKTHMGANRGSQEAYDVKDKFKIYFSSHTGQVEFPCVRIVKIVLTNCLNNLQRSRSSNS